MTDHLVSSVDHGRIRTFAVKHIFFRTNDSFRPCLISNLQRLGLKIVIIVKILIIILEIQRKYSESLSMYPYTRFSNVRAIFSRWLLEERLGNDLFQQLVASSRIRSKKFAG